MEATSASSIHCFGMIPLRCSFMLLVKCAPVGPLLVGSEVRLQHFQDLELLMDVQIHPGSFNPGVGIGLAGSNESCRGDECSQSLRG